MRNGRYAASGRNAWIGSSSSTKPICAGCRASMSGTIASVGPFKHYSTCRRRPPRRIRVKAVSLLARYSAASSPKPSAISRWGYELPIPRVLSKCCSVTRSPNAPGCGNARRPRRSVTYVFGTSVTHVASPHRSRCPGFRRGWGQRPRHSRNNRQPHPASFSILGNLPEQACWRVQRISRPGLR